MSKEQISDDELTRFHNLFDLMRCEPMKFTDDGADKAMQMIGEIRAARDLLAPIANDTDLSRLAELARDIATGNRGPQMTATLIELLPRLLSRIAQDGAEIERLKLALANECERHDRDGNALLRCLREAERLAKLVRCYPDSVDCGPTFVCPTCEASDRGGFVVHAADCPRMEFDRRYPLKDSGAA